MTHEVYVYEDGQYPAPPVLNEFAKRFLKDNFGLQLQIPIYINYNLETAMGRFAANSFDNSAVFIDLAGFLMEYGTDAQIEMTLKHELVHYAMGELQLPNGDGDTCFEYTLNTLNIGSTGSDHVKRPRNYYVYECEGPHIHLPGVVKYPDDTRCSGCGGVLRLIQIVPVDLDIQKRGVPYGNE